MLPMWLLIFALLLLQGFVTLAFPIISEIGRPLYEGDKNPLRGWEKLSSQR